MMEAVETTCCADMHANIDITAQLQHSLVNEVLLDAPELYDELVAVAYICRTIAQQPQLTCRLQCHVLLPS